MWHSVWNDAGTLNRIAAAFALFALAAFGAVAVKTLAARPDFAIKRVVVSGKLANADPAHIATVVQHELRGTFFTLDLGGARDALQRVAWVRRVAVRRHWPASIEIEIEEHQPLARWNDNALVNTYGEVFDAEYGDELPDFYAPDGTALEVTARYREFTALIHGSQQAIDSLSRSARGAWDVKLDDGLEIALGREQVGERWSRWMQVSERYRNRIGQGRELAAVDMRYPNGFAARSTGEIERPLTSARTATKAPVSASSGPSKDPNKSPAKG